MRPTRLLIPHDILVDIFLEYVFQGGSPLTISAVCRQWRYSALSIPRLWLRISLLPETRCLQLASSEERLRTLAQRAGAHHTLEVVINPSPSIYRIGPAFGGHHALKLVHLLSFERVSESLSPGSNPSQFPHGNSNALRKPNAGC